MSMGILLESLYEKKQTKKKVYISWDALIIMLLANGINFSHLLCFQTLCFNLWLKPGRFWPPLTVSLFHTTVFPPTPHCIAKSHWTNQAVCFSIPVAEFPKGTTGNKRETNNHGKVCWWLFSGTKSCRGNPCISLEPVWSSSSKAPRTLPYQRHNFVCS